MSPKTILINNIELDHPDCYKSEKEMIDTFQKFVNKLKKDDLLIINNDSKQSKKIKTKAKIFTFGIKNISDLMAKNIKIDVKNQKQIFDLYFKNYPISKIETHLPGIINIYNILASLSISFNYNVDINDAKKAILNFDGI
ncbi:MAG: Mur ligase family protein [Candidatus Paceibacterota bacterium]|nr:Mur ligase family protein [Candidatus Paceibacterota bacterium]